MRRIAFLLILFVLPLVGGCAAHPEPQFGLAPQHGDIDVPSLRTSRIKIPQDRSLYILGPEMELHKTTVPAEDVADGWQNYQNWGQPIASTIDTHCHPTPETQPSADVF